MQGTFQGLVLGTPRGGGPGAVAQVKRQVEGLGDALSQTAVVEEPRLDPSTLDSEAPRSSRGLATS